MGDKKNFSHRATIMMVLSHAFLAIISFHAGCVLRIPTECPPCHTLNAQRSFSFSQQEETKQARTTTSTVTTTTATGNYNNSASSLLPPTLKKLFRGLGRVDREAFAQLFDIGIPHMKSSPGNEEVLVWYSDESSMPSSSSSSLASAAPLLNPNEATERCISMDMILVKPGEERHCLVMMGHWQSSSVVHKWMRVPHNHNISARASLDQPLRMVSRTRVRSSHFLEFPIVHGVQKSLEFYTNYVKHMDDALEKLKPIAKACAGRGKTVVVMFCNHGQSELFINFVCSARARGLDTSQVLLLAADAETRDLAEGLGIAVFFHEKVFGNLDKNAAKTFGDNTFMSLMLAKVYCLHLVSKLEYDILYQDADVIWNKNPLDFFLSPNIGDFDMYVHDDGSRSIELQPYHGNGGFFFIRYNKLTAYFLNVLIRQGEFILCQNEQTAMNLLMHDHASLTGLRVKTLSRDSADFVGGWHYHHHREIMTKWMKGDILPYVFHMSWTHHKFEKRQYLEQMGYFFVSDHCVGKTNMGILGIQNSTKDLAASCCVAKPAVTCHFSDKPSIIPCRDSPAKDKGTRSFW